MTMTGDALRTTSIFRFRSVEKGDFSELFCSVSQRVEINFIFSNFRILHSSCNVKKPKTNVKFSKRSRNKHRLNRFNPKGDSFIENQLMTMAGNALRTTSISIH
jgi:hypothetical protein